MHAFALFLSLPPQKDDMVFVGPGVGKNKEQFFQVKRVRHINQNGAAVYAEVIAVAVSPAAFEAESMPGRP
jgi:hypothetical protein